MIYLSLGSNMGDRMAFLQLAVGMIEYRIGSIQCISTVYETPPWGFESSPFFNACLGVTSTLSPDEVLTELLAIETFLGRKRTETEGYQARTIDLDILFYKNKVLDTAFLTLPHPRIEQRKFILTPLAEIASDFTHPLFAQTIDELNQNCEDEAELIQLSKKLILPKKKDFIAIEGTIGAGKTAFAHRLNEALKGRLLLERFYDNPYLADFYKDPEAYAILVETAFLEERVNQYNSFFSEELKLPVIADYSLEKSLLFASKNLSKKDFDAYQKKYFNLTHAQPKPDLVLLLQQTVSQALYNIKQRGRAFEQSIAPAYLNSLENGYKEWRKTTALDYVELDLTAVDFVKRPEDFYPLLLAFFRH